MYRLLGVDIDNWSLSIFSEGAFYRNFIREIETNRA